MATFNAGYETNRQGRFTRSGTTARESRPARSLPKIQAFTLSHHYGGHLATTPSADFCPHNARRFRRARCPSHFGVRW